MDNFISIPPPVQSSVRLKTPPKVTSPSIVLPLPPPKNSVQNGLAVLSPQKRRRSNYAPAPVHQERRRGSRKKKLVPPSNSEPLSEHSTFDASFEHNVSDEGFCHQEEDSLEEDLGYSEYMEYIQAGAVGMLRLERDLYAVQGWDGRRKIPKTSWHHLHCTTINDTTVTICFCPSVNTYQECVHTNFLNDFGKQQFPEDEIEDRVSHRLVILFSWDLEAANPTQLFSVASESRQDSVKARAIVSHVGSDFAGGDWTCSRDGKTRCAHVRAAQEYLATLGRLTPDKVSSLAESPPIASPRGLGPVSYKPILPPQWAALPSDRNLYTRPSVITLAPTSIPLNDDARCSCGTSLSQDLPKVWETCKVYTLHGEYTSEIELQICPNRCTRNRLRYVGPDGAQLGLFNFNNRSLFSHDLLDDYTLCFTTSETPFTAWVLVMETRYQCLNPNSRFVSEEVFRAAWFAYASLQCFEGDMRCPVCGPEPSTVIFDGITLAFGRKHLTKSLKPPTAIDEFSPIRDCRPVRKQTALEDRSIRSCVRKIIMGPLAVTDTALKDFDGNGQSETDGEDVESDEGIEGSSKSKGSRKHLKGVLERVRLIPSTLEKLYEVDVSVGKLFEKYFRAARIFLQQPISKEIVALFREIAAEESILQMIPNSSISLLRKFNKNPSYETFQGLKSIPSLYYALRFEYWENDGKIFSPELLGTCCWLESRGENVLKSLIQHKSDPPDGVVRPQDKWLKTGSLYSMPQIRSRPQYPRLKHDQNPEATGVRGGKCSKHYNEYGERRLTGGIMVCWCTHSVSYGFHCIPKAEGRNDVFSAVYTHWKKAPDWIIYDFACSSGPYCMSREPDFFKDTRHGIDDCHSNGHTKCSAACFVKTYADLDPRLAKVNTSAAECGNSGLGRIRKSVSYMRQDRAIIYIRVFLAIWNRLKIRRILQGKYL